MKVNWINKIITLGLVMAIFAVLPTVFVAQDGATLFKNNCASCHKVLKGSTGPKLKGAKALWAAEGEEELIYEWIKNPVELFESGKSKRAAVVINYAKSNMPAQNVTKEEMIAILDYADATPEPTPVVADAGGAALAGGKEDSSTNYLIWLLVGILVASVVAYAAIAVKNLLASAIAEKNGEELEELTAKEKASSWIRRNWRVSLFCGIVLGLALGVEGFARGYEVGTVSDYMPSQPIKYSHKLHAGEMAIDCKYCHNSVEKSKHAGIPTTNVCMNCHSSVYEGKENGTVEIAKIHAAAGFSAEDRDYIYDEDGDVVEGTPIVWNKAHNMPDHVYFSHAQHVNENTGNIDCRQCHGDVKTYTLGRVSTNAEINELAKTDDKIIALEKPIMTMGWCLECHNKKSVDLTKSGYYDEIHSRLKNRPDAMRRILEDDGEVSVKELGGWECAKCHY